MDLTDDQLLEVFNLKDMFYTIRNMQEDEIEWLINDLLKNNTDWDVHDAKSWINTVMECMENILIDNHKEIVEQPSLTQFNILNNRLHEETN